MHIVIRVATRKNIRNYILAYLQLQAQPSRCALVICRVVNSLIKVIVFSLYFRDSNQSDSNKTWESIEEYVEKGWPSVYPRAVSLRDLSSQGCLDIHGFLNVDAHILVDPIRIEPLLEPLAFPSVSLL